MVHAAKGTCSDGDITVQPRNGRSYRYYIDLGWGLLSCTFRCPYQIPAAFLSTTRGLSAFPGVSITPEHSALRPNFPPTECHRNFYVLFYMWSATITSSPLSSVTTDPRIHPTSILQAQVCAITSSNC